MAENKIILDRSTLGLRSSCVVVGKILSAPTIKCRDVERLVRADNKNSTPAPTRFPTFPKFFRKLSRNQIFQKFYRSYTLNSLKDSYPNIVVLYKIFLTLPITSASALRSFSRLKLIKSIEEKLFAFNNGRREAKFLGDLKH